jgi:hypothetical protein
VCALIGLAAFHLVELHWAAHRKLELDEAAASFAVAVQLKLDEGEIIGVWL